MPAGFAVKISLDVHEIKSFLKNLHATAEKANKVAVVPAVLFVLRRKIESVVGAHTVVIARIAQMTTMVHAMSIPVICSGVFPVL